MFQIDLALTYASRSQHLRLARQISQLIQQKFLENLDSDLSEDDSADEAEGGVSNGFGDHAHGEEFQYAKEREKSLKKEMLTLHSSRNTSRQQNGAPSGRSKFAEIMKRAKMMGKSGSRNHTHKGLTRE